MDDPQITLDDIRAQMPPSVQVMLDQAIQAALNAKLRQALAEALNKVPSDG